jgi:hypothetical protein
LGLLAAIGTFLLLWFIYWVLTREIYMFAKRQCPRTTRHEPHVWDAGTPSWRRSTLRQCLGVPEQQH